MRRITFEPRARALSEAYAIALIVLYGLSLPFSGYEQIMEEKFTLFLALGGLYLAAMCAVCPVRALVRRGAAPYAALVYLGVTALGALLSPYGSTALLGGSRKDGLLTVFLYVACYLCLAGRLRPKRRLVWCAAAAATLCCALVLVQQAGLNPFGLYPDELGYWDGDVAYMGFYAGTAGNIDFTAFLLALAAAAMGMTVAVGGSPLLLLPLALTLYTLWRLGVAAAFVGLGACALLSPLLLMRRRGRAWALTLLLCVLALGAVFCYRGENATLRELSRVLHGELDNGFGSGRVGIWRAVWALVRERPLLGGGCGTLHLRDLPPLYWQHDGRQIAVAITSAHNEYLGILADQGVFALGAFLTLCGLSLRRCLRAGRRGAVCGAVLVCYLAQAFFAVATPVTGAYLWVILAICEAFQEGTP